MMKGSHSPTARGRGLCIWNCLKDFYCGGRRKSQGKKNNMENQVRKGDVKGNVGGYQGGD